MNLVRSTTVRSEYENSLMLAKVDTVDRYLSSK